MDLDCRRAISNPKLTADGTGGRPDTHRAGSPRLADHRVAPDDLDADVVEAASSCAALALIAELPQVRPR